MLSEPCVMRNPDSDRDSVLNIVRENPMWLKWACREFQDDYEIVLAAMDNKYAADGFKHASARLRANWTIAEMCVVRDKYEKCISFIDPCLMEDRAFILAVIPIRPYVFKH